MQVAQYIFQSPSSTPVQVGRLDPNSLKEDTSQSDSLPKAVENQTAVKAESFAQREVSEVKPTVGKHTLDVYA